jgi:uncharacterized membrane protein
MPFCTNCGTQVNARASFCQSCGSPQKPGPPQPGDVLSGISDRAACILCYIPVFGVIPAIIILASQKFRANFRVRFNAFQGLYMFVAWLIISSAAPTLLLAGTPGHVVEHLVLSVMKSALLFAWIFMVVKAAHQQEVRLPIIGDLAARSTHEQL